MYSLRQGTGTPLLLVHGLRSSSQTWARVMPSLAARREVVAVDLPGFGRTAPLSGPVTVATLTDAVEEFVRAEHLESADVAGSSMGARMVLEMARRGHRGSVVALDLPAKVVIGWGRDDRVTVPSQARRAVERFPDASLHWFDRCGHFPHWDQPAETSDPILQATG